MIRTAECVSPMHPDKMCDRISDALLDLHLKQDPNSRCAIETMGGLGEVYITGEVSSIAIVTDEEITNIVHRITQDSNIKVTINLNQQSPEIAQGVDADNVSEQGDGDQGLMLGFACKETEELMPLPIQIAQRLTEKLSRIRKDGTLPWLRPDGKSQVTVEYDGFKPLRVTKVVIATQHDDMLSDCLLYTSPSPRDS